MATRKKALTPLELILRTGRPERRVKMNSVKDDRGRPLEVVVRSLSGRDAMAMQALLKDEKDPLRQGLITISFAVRDVKTGERIFTEEAVDALGECNPVIFNELAAAWQEVQAEVSGSAKK